MSCIPKEHKNQVKHIVMENLEKIAGGLSEYEIPAVLSEMEVGIDMVKKGQVPRENTRNDYYQALLELFHETLKNYSDDLEKFKKINELSYNEQDAFREAVIKNRKFIEEYKLIANGASYRGISNCNKERKNLKTIHEKLVNDAAQSIQREYRRLYEKIDKITFPRRLEKIKIGATLEGIALEPGLAGNKARQLLELRKSKMYNQPGGGYTRRNGAKKRRSTRSKKNL